MASTTTASASAPSSSNDNTNNKTASSAMEEQHQDKKWTKPVETAIARLKSLGINFLAVDFDCTMIDIHTGGRWQGTTDELCVHHVRPYFGPLLTAALNHGICVAVVTFSPQVQVVRAVLQHLLGETLSRNVPIRAGGGQFTYQGGGMRDGKQAHMASAVEELQQVDGGNVEITKATSLLIDDDVKNIRTALRDGVRAIWLNPSQADELLRDMARLI